MTDPMDDLRQASADVSGIELKQQLSPAANAVLTAVTLKRYDVPPEGLPAFAEEMAPLIAAALRAAAYQVTPARPVLDSCCEHFEQAIRHKILAIAAELEAQ